MRARGRVDQDQVRSARPGEAHIIAAGRVARARIIRTAIGDDTRIQAAELIPGERPIPPTQPPRLVLPDELPPGELPP